MSIHAVEEKHGDDKEMKPLALTGEKLKRYEYCGFTADSFGELQVQIEELGLQWHPEAVIDTATGLAVGK